MASIYERTPTEYQSELKFHKNASKVSGISFQTEVSEVDNSEWFLPCHGSGEDSSDESDGMCKDELGDKVTSIRATNALHSKEAESEIRHQCPLKLKPRTKSFDRRLSEAAQYAEAVGEIHHEGNHVIIDDDEEEEDDEDDGEIINGRKHPTFGKRYTSESKDEIIKMTLASHLRSETMDTTEDVVHSQASDHASSLSHDRSSFITCADALNIPDLTTKTELNILRDNNIVPGDKSPSTGSVHVSHQQLMLNCDLGSASINETSDSRPFVSTRHKYLFHEPLMNGKYDNEEVKHIFSDTATTAIDTEKEDNNGTIRLNPPEVTKRGLSRGNFAQLHRKAWLEVSDKFHRYGKNLRLYYKHWEDLGHPTNVFFDWLDSKGKATGLPLPNLPECPRSALDSDTVLYITNPEDQIQYKLAVVPVEAHDESPDRLPIVKAQLMDHCKRLVCTGPEGWIFVLRDNELYAAKKVTSILGHSKKRFHHSSFFGGKAVAAAGILITDDNGYLKYLYPHSGHYRPGEAHMQRMLFYLYGCCVDISSFQVDMQQIMHVSREKCDETTPKGGDVGESDNLNEEIKVVKSRKTESLYLETGNYVASFLRHKSIMICSGLFDQLNRIRTFPPGSTVREILVIINCLSGRKG